MNKYVVYSVMVGEYGEIHQPLYVDNRFDYILFSNDIKEKRIGVWQVRKFPEFIKNDNKRLSRYPKTHPETLLSEYVSSLYIDANVQIADQWVYDHCVELTNQGVDAAGIQLLVTGRDCIYRHAYDICTMRAENDMNAIVQCHELYKRGFPEHYGLNENNIIFRSNNERMRQVDEEWWWWITHYSFRDQFSYMYCFWKHGVERILFLPAGEDSRNSKHFVFTHHNSDNRVASKKWIKPGPFESMRIRCRNGEHYEQYCEQWVKVAKSSMPRVALFCCGITMIFVEGVRMLKRKCNGLYE